MRIVRVVDIETTGLEHADGAEICEVGYTDVCEDGSVGGSHGFFVNPGHAIPPEMSAIHHILDEDVALAISPLSARRSMEIGLDSSDIVFAAHNASFEMKFIYDAHIKWICTYKCAHHIYPDFNSYSNQALRYILRLPVDKEYANQVHRAGPDSHVTAHLLSNFIRAGLTIDEMVEISRKPVLLKTIPFSKHKGQKFSEIDRGFLEWILRQDDMSEEVVYSTQVELERRANETRENPFNQDGFFN